MKIEDIDLETCTLTNIRAEYDDLDSLGASLEKGQQEPINVGPLLNGERQVFNGCRRILAARKRGMKTLKGIVSDYSLLPAELSRYQFISDIHKKHLTACERSLAAIEIEIANPTMTVKQLAALVDMDDSLLWKYLQAKKLSPESMDAFRAGVIGLTDVVEMAKLSHDQQPVFLALKLTGASRDKMRQSRKKSTEPAVRAAKIKCPLPGGQVVTVSGGQLSLDDAIEALGKASKLMKTALSDGLNAKTAEKVWTDVAATG